MNKHDSERVAGMLDMLGAYTVETPEEADIVVYMTCCVREAADVRLYGQVASLKNVPAPKGRRIVAIGGCIGQRDGEMLTEKLENADIVFGTHNISHLPDLILSSLEHGTRAVEVLEKSDDFPTDLPSQREFPWHAWVPIAIGCDNFCSYCIVPYVRGREKSRPFEEIISELGRLATEGVHEVTLLGQNVNSYGRDLYGEPRFAQILEAAGNSGIERIRFATSHPKDLSIATIDAMATIGNVMPQLHLPVQSGSDRILQAMNRKYTAKQYLELIDSVRDRVGDIALSTDIIVGFPGETEEDFLATLRLCEEVAYSQAFTFIYSKREGTPAAKIIDDTPHEVIQERFDRLVSVIQASAYEQNQAEKNTVQRILVEGVSKRDSAILSGRTPKNQMVHAPLSAHHTIADLVGTFVDVRIDVAKTWYLSGTIVGS
ncbi:MAG: tRNA (N6-isopentenyl adenosine(37)-C2)-methylthiotransferase MiaB [Actinobacteria bacterium]|nr:tRNA (N6-isopentenyl adenosine(37)-C2)-methylthiotransferase MiaB [Actinomycetota bacterium]